MKERYGNSISTWKKFPKIGIANCGIVARSSRNIIMLHWKTLFLFSLINDNISTLPEHELLAISCKYPWRHCYPDVFHSTTSLSLAVESTSSEWHPLDIRRFISMYGPHHQYMAVMLANVKVSTGVALDILGPKATIKMRHYYK